MTASKAAGQEESVNASNQAECDPFPAGLLMRATQGLTSCFANSVLSPLG